MMNHKTTTLRRFSAVEMISFQVLAVRELYFEVVSVSAISFQVISA